MADELIDIYDENMNKIGTAMKSQAHREGLWHMTFHCWIVKFSPDGDNKIWLQLRSKNKDSAPGQLDITAAGHLRAGETAKDGIREIKEELGVEVDFNRLSKLFTDTHVSRREGRINQEFTQTYLLEAVKSLSDLTPAPDEVDGVFEVSVKDMFNLFNNKVSQIFIGGFIRDEHGALKPHTGSVTINDFAAHGVKYYQKVLNIIQNYFEGKKNHAR